MCGLSGDDSQLLVMRLRHQGEQDVADAYVVDLRTGGAHLVGREVTDAAWLADR